MNKKPILLRSLFALLVVAVFIWSMFPVHESDFFDTFKALLEKPESEQVTELIEKAKKLREDDPFKYPYPSTALDKAAKETKITDASGNTVLLNLTKLVKPAVVKQQKLKTNSDVISLVRKNAAGSFRLGIDLNGGAEFLLLLKADTEDSNKNFEKYRDNAVETIRKRLESQNYYETDISPAGSNLISVRVPVVTEDEKSLLEQLVLRSAKLEFRLVHENNATIVRDIELEASKSGKTPQEYFAANRPELARDYDLLTETKYDDDNNIILINVLVEKLVRMEGDHINNAGVTTDKFGKRGISLGFDRAGSQMFGELTSDYCKGGKKNSSAERGRQLAIVLDGVLYSAPNLNEPILDGSASITGDFNEDEAKGLADALLSGSLPFEISIVHRSDIQSSVGKETVRKSLYSGIIGTVLVMIFMLIYYRLAGLIANISLAFNAALLLGALAAFDVTLTLPGIAGIILTIGMAVDANVLIYERIREEINSGKSVMNSVDIGFGKAFSAIFDSNLTTLFVAMILFWQGTGAIKGFALTLSIGIFTTFFTAVFMTRLFFELMLRAFGTHVKRLNMMAFLRNPKINFVGIRKYTFGFSIACVVLSLCYMGYLGRDMLGIDFTGGTQLLVDYRPANSAEKVDLIPADEIVRYLNSQGFDSKASYKKTTDETGVDMDQLELVVKNLGDMTGSDLIERLDKNYPQVKFTKTSESTLGALIGWEFTKSAIIALLLAVLGMIIYMIIRFQLSYSIAANIALVHDVIVSMGIYLVFGGQLTLQVVASLLTLIGYSLNDTIVTFDRQRENLTLMQGKTYLEIVNTSVNQTLGRTILTSLSVVLILVAQLVLGGDGIRDFIAVMLIGCFVGCYSSIFISPIITAYWHKRIATVRETSAGPASEKA